MVECPACHVVTPSVPGRCAGCGRTLLPCARCGGPLLREHRFCRSCGAPAAAPAGKSTPPGPIRRLSGVFHRPSTGPAPLVGSLLLRGPGGAEREIALDPATPLVIGREAPSTVVIADAGVSRQHLRIECTGGVVEAVDLGSRNGTRVNGEPLKGRHALAPGDELQLGPYRLLARPRESGGTAIVRWRRPGTGRRWAGWVVLGGGVLVAALAGVWLLREDAGSSAPANAQPVAAVLASNVLPSESQQITEAVRRVRPAVVRVRTKADGGTGVGTGIIIEDGLVATNAHVVDGDNGPTVTLADGRELRGQVLGVDERVDLALIKLPVTGLPMAVWGDSDALQPGERLVAIGYALGASAFVSGEPTVTSGIFSGRREYRGQIYVQTDTPLNFGNSGGPLINLRGEVIGVNVLVIGRTPEQQAQGLNLAIPAAVARPLLPTLRDKPAVRQPTAAATANAAASAATGQAKSYQNPTYGYRLRFPPTWRLDESDPNSVVITAGSGAGVVIDSETQGRARSLADYAESVIAASKRSLTGFTLVNRATKRLASGIEVAALRIKWSEKGQTYEAIEYLAVDGPRGYDLTALAPAGRFAEVEKALEEVLLSFSPR